MIRQTILERVFRRLLRESNDPVGLGAFVREDKEHKTAFIYDTNAMIDLIRNNKELGENPHFSHFYGGLSLSSKIEARRFAKDRALKGFIEIKIPDARDTGSCYGASIVSMAAGPGYGREIYGLGYALSKNGLLTPDRTSVSDKATAAWKSVEEKGRKRHEFDDWRLKRTPPLEDDCKLHHEKEKQHLNYAYEAEGWEHGFLRFLVAQHDAAMEELSDIPNVREEVETLIATVAIGEFWQKHFWNR